MTVSTTNVDVIYTTDGVVTEFPTTFQFLLNSHVKVQLNGVLLNSGYAVTGANDEDGGTVVFDVAPAVGEDDNLFIYRELPLTQDIAPINNSTIFGNVLGRGLDTTMMVLQQFGDGIDRAIKVAPGAPMVDPSDVIDAATLISTRAATDGSNVVGAFAANAPFTAPGTGTFAETLLEGLTRDIHLSSYSTGIPNSADFQRAINDAIAAGKNVILPPSMIADGPVTIAGEVGIIGPAKKCSVVSSAATFNWLTLQASDITIMNLRIDDFVKVGGWDFTLDTATTPRERTNISNILSFHSKGSVRDIGTSFHVTTNFTNYYARIQKGPGFDLRRPFGYLKLDDCTVDFNGSGASGNFTGFNLAGTGLGPGSGGGSARDCHVLGEADSGNTSQHGWIFTDYSAFEFSSFITADNCAGKGFQFIRCNKIEGKLSSGQCQGDLVTFEDTTFSNLEISYQGRKGLPGATAGSHGIVFRGTLNNAINISFGSGEDVTGDHVRMVATQGGPIVLGSGVATNATGRAANITGTSSFNWTGFSLAGNAANYTLGAANQWMNGQFQSGGYALFNGPGSA